MADCKEQQENPGCSSQSIPNATTETDANPGCSSQSVPNATTQTDANPGCSSNATTETDANPGCSSQSIPNATTKTDATPCSSKYLQPKYCQKKIKPLGQFFIEHLLKASVTKQKVFTIGNFQYQKGKIRGKIVSVWDLKAKRSVTVNDGTGEIDCIIEAKNRADEIRSNVQAELEQLKCSDSDLNKASAILLRTASRILRRVPSVDDVNLGDTIMIIGKLSEYNGRRYMFVENIRKCFDDALQDDFYRLQTRYYWETMYTV